MSEIGEVDLFGLDEFGSPAGLNPVWGAVGGGIVTTGATLAAEKMGAADPSSLAARHSETIGMGVGLLAGGLLAAFPGTRAAGWTAIATALSTNGVRAVAKMMASSGATHGAWGEVRVEPTRAFQGLGMVSAEQRTALSGLNGPLPTLVGAGMGTPARGVQILGGPTVSALAGHYGSTVFGGGN